MLVELQPEKARRICQEDILECASTEACAKQISSPQPNMFHWIIGSISVDLFFLAIPVHETSLSLLPKDI